MTVMKRANSKPAATATASQENSQLSSCNFA
eukprot:CAMPEP_0172659816 /NCGR_PEP_ID=MMETSP1074-20121228/3703_1 /TAXON_ID=2916 /ORGANISM="Ceratium fusus, Strain PA161109" /LENGTH=30 /DNA_ID= /DNA_START= /DNA_END= /DNA_ORIENTATION=